MKDLVISMESTCDILPDTKKEYDIEVFDMEFFVGEECFSSKNDDVVSSKIYQKMREGQKTSTSQINETLYEENFRKLMKTGKPILHIAFSGGLSGSCGCAKAVAARLNQEYEPKILVVDSKGACQGQVLLAISAREYVGSAKDIYELAAYVQGLADRTINRFSVDNLKYLAAGGRISGASAVVGNLLKIKPIIKADENGKLLSFTKVISRKKALKVMVEQFVKEVDKNSKFCYISHSDCEEDALFMKEMVEAETDFVPVVTYIGPVLGCHCGPGTVAMFYLGNKR